MYRLHGSFPDRHPHGSPSPSTFDGPPSAPLAWTLSLCVAGFVQPESVMQLRGRICIHLERESQDF